MLKKIKNNTIHIIPLRAGIIPSFGEKEVEITKEELEHFKDKISDLSTDTKADKISEQVKQVEKVKQDKPKDGILNKHIIDDYMDRSSRTLLNRIDEDKPGLTKENYDLMLDYETSHKNRDNVLQKIKKLRGE